MKEMSLTFKIILLGDSNVGKSSILKRYSENTFSEQQAPTIGLAFYKKVVERKNIKITLEIWDTAGQEKFKKIAPIYYRNAQAVLICFDVSNRDTLEGAKRWLEEIDKYLDPDCVKFLVGNKQDYGSFEIDQAFLESNHMKYIQTSAKTGHNVDMLFRRVARTLAKTKIKKMENLDQKAIITLQVQGQEEKQKASLCC
ncbi:unnamed protein product (macronuclear) [Paramecium tetraurelia]|uniref:Chromosome undetermined scaffold_155, whole genome shotgun sequence n=1 Tax=Paramecium tetraurelia TaxID=5888 RepID=Q3SDJ8_PARTE|nr:uncharacterized protein GSPATT00035828001 [Paramecium tetraurelia]CAI39360.1 rab_A46 [Paramecium tetraurelia]CAK66698.1 unnamed protein product [Paramecium tetraurelia]|eukprot:XP_001434095.1 hypothetical protein (macronuclear) [Paramecium tetraurelia strain d4-2]